MRTVGLSALQRQAADLVRLTESGEEVIVTMAGRPRARLVPVEVRTWRL
ncbi:type II toxin-antitoxin system Phd/YefM family antitoxin [Modestobacter marinus]